MNNTLVLYGSGAYHLATPADRNLVKLSEFAGRETRTIIEVSVRERDVILIQGFGRVPDKPKLGINDLFMEAILMADAIKRAGCHNLTLIFTMFPYARQDRKHRPGVPISAKVICDIVSTVGVDRLVTFDLHADQIQGFINSTTIFDHLSLLPFMCREIEDELHSMGKTSDKFIMVSTDAGAVNRTRMVGNLLHITDLAIISKLRNDDVPNEVQSAQLIGNVEGKICITVDDMIDTAGTLATAHRLLKQNGADKILTLAPHGVLSNNARDRLAPFHRVYMSDTVTHTAHEIPKESNIKVISILEFLNRGLIPRLEQKLPLGVLMKIPFSFPG